MVDLGSAERPFQGVVLCFTSIGPDERTRYADLASQMGAEHKLDLTSDTTHLIVGDTDTAKYKYVAREREDIKVLRPQWIEAVRELWIKDLPLDLDALATEYRMPTMSGLKICITGFDDLSFRAQLQQNVIENGGEYTGDLTKDVTHLIAAKPEGKKYEYALSWQKKVVSLKWYKDTLDRGMQLDETLYHPSMPAAEQGVGAWKRRPQLSPRSSKRTREETSAPEPSRKLRRTASARLGSQTQHMWTDIVGGAGFEADPADRPRLKPSVSMPALRQNEGPAHQHADMPSDIAAERFQASSGFLTGRQFIFRGFEERKHAIISKIVLDEGGMIIDAENVDAYERDETLLILPHDVRRKRRTADLDLFVPGLQTVSELWLERCMLDKIFIPPTRYPLGCIPGPSSTVLSSTTINVSGFSGLETLHVSKIVATLGGSYAETFAAGVSVLVIRSGSHNTQKLGSAQEWGIPVVSENWLWSTIKNGERAEFKGYLVQSVRAEKSQREEKRQSKARGEYVEVSTIPLQPEERKRREGSRNKSHHASKELVKTTRNGTKPRDVSVAIHQDPPDVKSAAQEELLPTKDISRDESNHGETRGASFGEEDLPLQELSSNSSGNKSGAVEATWTSLTAEAGESSTENKSKTDKNSNLTKPDEKASSILALNGAIRDILDQGIRRKPVAESEKPVKNNRLFGRALSNLSNASVSSNPRQSRASSIDSMNTDGMGSEIVPMPPERPAGVTGSSNERETTTFGFTGRAKTTMTMTTAAGVTPLSLGMDDLDQPLDKAHYMEEETPRLTQLGYEDPEEAIMLREKLAASRRRKSKLGQNEGDPQPAVATKAKPEKRKIRDDDIISSASWGAGRRTRYKQKSPPDQGIKQILN
ncbi:hypothetical protein PV08_09279 [Exophiala spinifera]|uniref:BRCT domain-containing protein n=1 Tax=Exophiala spinifera TaxID=91928 RepID=A0A0D2B022_9EURO|nr:uncharacterized protein PV08_09279 [Exophiala spinifera]KIW12005.1 hypothetical protein PV08_09279 [Exophiala spinifera]